ncbi:carbohydrate-binding protein [Thermanaerosceptrum fracticalcis]|uniref:Carbohydrate-binding protein n=1 Tax=Thermanaerosceptrum fracticalcis TaxID=1712410 RepID=A0A7G6DYU1_THEFR|nr:carbohydrate-binding protein [Thermanaerosceptrum fracticalcis]QNB44995.1 carbohydrate-binding protein [Thermanaerosceptrum fracticalcis]
MARKTMATENNKTRTSTVERGVSVEPMPVTAEDTITISYNGLLAQSGAAQVYAHIGYGSNENWSNVEDIPMSRAKDSWTCDVNSLDSQLNFCFHDGANNWDNNYGHNWSINIHDGEKSI